MQHNLTDQEYQVLKMKAEALDEIKRILRETPEEDEHGNSIPYAYRFDRTISRIMNVLDEVEGAKEQEGFVYQMPWFRGTGRLLKELRAR
jgi:hypothetical protein